MTHRSFPKTFLYMPATHSKGITKLESIKPDVAVLDLEDAIPLHEKEAARHALIPFFKRDGLIPIKAVRINSVKTEEGLKDLLWFLQQQWVPPIIVLSMVEEASEITMVKNILSSMHKNFLIYVTIETPIAVERIFNIAAISDGLIFGSADLAAALVVDINWDNMFYARSRIALSAAQYNIPAIDTACYVIDPLEPLLIESKRVASLGFTGKAAIHPSQVAIIESVFSLKKEEDEFSQRIVSEYEKNGGGVIKIDGKMIGPPFYEKAKKMIARNS